MAKFDLDFTFENIEKLADLVNGKELSEIAIEDQNGNKQQLEIPEAIHTYNAWKELGFQVQKGQKAVAQFTIWKYAAGKHTEAEAEGATEEAPGRMFLKKASFFSAAQVQAIA